MKRYLLTAASALVFTAAAGAQTFQISGEVTTSVSYDGSNNEFNGPQFWTDDVTLTMSGNGGGWEYQVAFEFDGSVNQVRLDNAGLGTFELRQDEIEWRKNLLGDTLLLSTQFMPDDIFGTLEIGLEGTAAGVSYEAEIYNDANRSFQLQLGMPIFGVEFEAETTGSLADTSVLDYGIQAGFDAFGVEAAVMWTSMGYIGVEAVAGGFYAESNLTNGDLFSQLQLGYSLDITEQMQVGASVYMDGSSTSGSAEMYLQF